MADATPIPAPFGAPLTPLRDRIATGVPFTKDHDALLCEAVAYWPLIEDADALLVHAASHEEVRDAKLARRAEHPAAADVLLRHAEVHDWCAEAMRSADVRAAVIDATEFEALSYYMDNAADDLAEQAAFDAEDGDR